MGAWYQGLREDDTEQGVRKKVIASVLTMFVVAPLLWTLQWFLSLFQTEVTRLLELLSRIAVVGWYAVQIIYGLLHEALVALEALGRQWQRVRRAWARRQEAGNDDAHHDDLATP